MSGSVNKVILVGRLGADPDMKYTPGGAGVCELLVATSYKWTDKQGQKQEKTEWTRVKVWGKSGEACAKYLGKGREVYVEGRLETRSWEKDGVKRYATEVIAEDVQFLGGKGGDRDGRGASGGGGAEYAPAYDGPSPDDGIPF